MPARQPLDRRAHRSRAALEAALLDLLTDRALTAISVADLTKRADVNRSTFYEHYTDVHDLAASACTDLFDELIAASPVLGPDTTPEQNRRGQVALTELFVRVADHAPLYRALLGPDGSARVINHLHQRLTIAIHVDLAIPTTATHADDPAEIPHDPTSSLLAGALLGVIADWLRRDCPTTPQELAAAIWPMMPRPTAADPAVRQPGR